MDTSPLRLTEAIRVGTGILSGLAHIHVRGYIHFDIKPSNILFSDKNTPMVADFGQTRRVVAGGVVHRPPMYPGGIPPECYGGVGTFQSDIYQAGLTMYRAVNGDAFFNEQRPEDDGDVEAMTVSGKFPDRSLFMPHVPKWMRTVIRTAIAPEPSKRYVSPTDFSDALGKVQCALDWETVVSETGEIEWRAGREEQPDVVVRLRRNGNRWATESYTHGAKLRKLDPKVNWRFGLTYRQAMDHLKTLFETLG